MLVQTCMSFCLLLNTKQDILMSVSEQLTVAIDFHSMEKILWESVETGNGLVILSFLCHLLSVPLMKKSILTYF